ncbi:MAG: hypothetical protein IJN21_04605 [Clostridia bacterium]|nr:hypothetical protein [Clostridia bacterium]
MCKKMLVILILLCILSTSALGEQMKEEYAPTTDKEILFLNITWNETAENASRFIQETFPAINSIETDENRHYGFSDPTRKISEYVEADQAQITSLNFERITDDRYGLSSPLGIVAGYGIVNLSMCFLHNDDFGLFEARYYLGIDNNNEIYIDLKHKLSDLYGIPYEYEIEATGFTGKELHKNAVWIGANSTAVYLEYTRYYTGYLAGSESISLCYGTTAANAIIERLAAEEAKLEEQLEEQRKEELQNNHTGL